MAKKIIFTGGGSAGHVMVNIALIPKFQKDGWDVQYIGSNDGIEKELIHNLNNIKYHKISTGKLRRYFSWQNFKDPFKVMKGILQAYRILKKEKPNVIFSKGGFVSVPVVIAGWMNKIPVIIHESDITPGLANKIAIPFASKVLTTFPETVKAVDEKKAIHAGAVVREELLRGNSKRGLEICGFTNGKPIILVMGGSLGAKRINESIRENLDKLLSDFQIVHICGKGNVDNSYDASGYKQFEYINKELPDIFAMADLVVSRAGSNAIFEFLALKKPMLLIPLSREASRGDQILNAESFRKLGFSQVLYEEDLNKETLLENIYSINKKKSTYLENMLSSHQADSVSNILNLIQNEAKA